MPRSAHGALTANTVAGVTIDAGLSVIQITNRSATGEIYFTTDGSAPTVGGAGTFVCLGTRLVSAPSPFTATLVRLISTGTPNYTVEGESS